MRRTVLSTALFAMIIAGGVARADWAQFEGPDRSGVAPAIKLMAKWPAEGPEVLWTKRLGAGFGAAAVKDAMVFVLDRPDSDSDVLRVFDLQKGGELWRYQYESKGRFSHPGSRSTPTVDDDHVYSVSSLGQVYCISRKTHKPVWTLHINKEYPEGRLKWGFAQSPLLHDGKLIVTPVSPDSPGLIAINKDDGKVIWESEKFGGDYYSSPTIRTIAGVTGVLQIFNNDVVFVNTDNGKIIWKYSGYYCKFPIPAPTVLPDGKTIFITGGYEAGSVMIRVNKSASGYKFDELFKMVEGSHLHPVIHHGGFLYANINENKTTRGAGMKNGGLACIDPANGKVLWRTGDNPHLNRGNFVLADGKFIMLDGQLGDLYLIEPSSKGFRPISKSPVLKQQSTRKQNEVWAPIAISDGLAIVRDQRSLKCVRVGADSGPR